MVAPAFVADAWERCHKREDRKTAYIQALAVASVIRPPQQLPYALSSLLGVPLWDVQHGENCTP